MNKKYKKLSINVILFSISSFGQKILAFLLIPLYTGFLSTDQYGTIDLVSTTVNLLVPLMTLNISEAVMRFTIDDKENDAFIMLGVRTMVKGTCVLFAALAILSIFPFLTEFKKYFLVIAIVFFMNSIFTLMQNYLRAIGRIQLMVCSSLFNSLIMLVLDILLIVKFKLGIYGYYGAMISGLMFAIIMMEIGAKMHTHINFHNNNSKAIKKECLAYSIPTVFTTLAWWINSSLDRYFVTAMCGVSANGIYSIAYKIPTILGVFQSIFTQAWTLSAINEFDKNDKDGFFGNTYEMYNSMMVILTSIIILFNMLLSRILYANEFFVAWKFVPLLLISSLFSAMSGYLGSIFSAVKDTKTCAYSTIASAVINIILNTILIPKYEGSGAAFATAISYIAAWFIRIVVSRKYIIMRMNIIKDIIIYALLVGQAFFSMTTNHCYYIQIILLAIIIIINFKIYRGILLSMISKILTKK